MKQNIPAPRRPRRRTYETALHRTAERELCEAYCVLIGATLLAALPKYSQLDAFLQLADGTLRFVEFKCRTMTYRTFLRKFGDKGLMVDAGKTDMADIVRIGFRVDGVVVASFSCGTIVEAVIEEETKLKFGKSTRKDRGEEAEVAFIPAEALVVVAPEKRSPGLSGDRPPRRRR